MADEPKNNRKPPPEESRWKKGQSGNPKGRQANPITKALRNLTVKEYQEVINLALKGNLRDLQALINDPNTSCMQVGVATALAKAIKAGDVDIIDRLASRIIGKIPDKFEFTGEDGGPIEIADHKYVVILPPKKDQK